MLSFLFGRKRKSTRKHRVRRRYNVPGSACNGLRKSVCQSNPNCAHTRRGCRRRGGTATKGVVYEGPSMQYGRKLPKAFVKKCRKHGIKTTRKVGSRRVPKKMSVLKRQLKKKMRKHKRRSTRRKSTRRRVRRFGFGFF